MNSLVKFATLIQDGDGSSAGAVAIIVTLIIVLICLAIYIASIVWVYRDANQRGKNGLLVALLVALISWPISLLVWVLIRNRM